MVRVNRFEEDAVPSHPVKVENGCVWVRSAPATARRKKLQPAHSLARPVARQPGGLRVVDISTTVQDPANPRYSTSEAPLEVALHHAREELPCETPLLKLSELKFRACEGAYATRAQACTGPCSVTQMDAADQMTPAYETLVHWVDVVLLAPPLRWGQASPLYFKMAERLHCVQNPDHPQRPRAEPKQGGQLHHYRRTRQRPRRGVAVAGLFQRIRRPHSAVSLQRPRARLDGGGQGEKYRRRPAQRRMQGRRPRTRDARHDARRSPIGCRRATRPDAARWSQRTPAGSREPLRRAGV